MKRIIVIIIVLFSVVTTLHAQVAVNDTSKRSNAKATQPIVTKGYYAIYKNAEKLSQSGPLISIASKGNETVTVQPVKGYYSMNNHHRKIYKSGVSFIAKEQKRPVSSKGYYNISLPANEVVKDSERKLDSAQLQREDSVFAVID